MKSNFCNFMTLTKERKIQYFVLGIFLLSVVVSFSRFGVYNIIIPFPLYALIGFSLWSSIGDFMMIIFSYVANTGGPMMLRSLPSQSLFFLLFSVQWLSVPLMIKYTSGIKKSRRIFYTWVVVSELAVVTTVLSSSINK